ncbi:hypothetical protein [Methylobacterium durans]|uniref:hypothetical protein n=1 Tax=Methylobacterium durans TaxID=2202825 RepID=UPI0013A57A5E|nr:hypothetical protein [Methylobacterium durans]
MTTSINLEVSPFIRNGFFGLRRDGRVIAHGRMPYLRKYYQPGDVVLVSIDTCTGLQARFAGSASTSEQRHAEPRVSAVSAA